MGVDGIPGSTRSAADRYQSRRAGGEATMIPSIAALRRIRRSGHGNSVLCLTQASTASLTSGAGGRTPPPCQLVSQLACGARACGSRCSTARARAPAG